MKLTVFAIFVAIVYALYNFSVSETDKAEAANKSERVVIGKLKDITVIEENVIRESLNKVSLMDGTTYVAWGTFNTYKSGDEVSVPADKESKFVCLRDTCLPLKK